MVRSSSSSCLARLEAAGRGQRTGSVPVAPSLRNCLLIVQSAPEPRAQVKFHLPPQGILTSQPPQLSLLSAPALLPGSPASWPPGGKGERGVDLW